MSDTIELLQECDAGIKMGIDAIDEVMSHVKNDEFKDKLIGYKKDYNSIQDEIDEFLARYNERGKNPDPFVKGMATVKTNVKMAISDNDATIADLLTNGCNMGVKSINKYLNRYVGADDEAKALTKELIRLMDRQTTDIRKYL